jgi:hypothetical protein
MVSVPARAAPGLGATARVTMPPPFPARPDVTAIHGTWLVATQPQPAAVVTVTVAGPPSRPTESSAGETL